MATGKFRKPIRTKETKKKPEELMHDLEEKEDDLLLAVTAAPRDKENDQKVFQIVNNVMLRIICHS